MRRAGSRFKNRFRLWRLSHLSLLWGSPRKVIEEAHKDGAKVIRDVTNLEHAMKVQDMGADGVIAVGTGAGGHAGPISPFGFNSVA